MTQGALLLLVDALRWDYIDRTSYLGGLARRGAFGRFQEPFGFTPRAAYFRGMDVEPDGFTHMFEWNPSRSPFAAARFARAACATRLDIEPRVRQALAARAQEHATPFVRSYVGPIAIPLEALPYFDVAERESPWGPDAPADNLFRRLSAAGLPWHTSAWPDTNGLSDAAVIARAIDGIRADHRFAFVHLSSLDGTGHAYGPGSAETQAALEETDRLVQALVEHCERIWTHPRIVLFGDHGMVRVVRDADVLTPLIASGLRFGRDFGYFVDSTAVRFWYFTSDARRTVRELFDAVDFGRFLDADDWTRFGLDRCSWRNGEDFFLAHAGVVFAPNFFGPSPPKGMHGYLPACADNQGAFIYWKPDDPQARDAGVVDASRLYSTCLHACGLAAPPTSPPPVLVERCQSQHSTYTAAGTARAEMLVSEDIAAIRERITAAVVGCEAIVLGGGFGRGEGFVRTTPALRAVNDYDVLVVGGTMRDERGGLRDAIEARCRVDAVDLSHIPAGYAVGPCQMGFDLRYGSTVTYGAGHLIRRWGGAAPDSITRADAWLGIANRVCGLLQVLDPSDSANGTKLLGLQLIKLGIAIGDGFLIEWRDYHHLLGVRLTRFAALSEAGALERVVRESITTAYRDKLESADGGEHWRASSLIGLRRAICALASQSLAHTADHSWHSEAARLAVEGRRRQCLVPVWQLDRTDGRADDRDARPDPLPADVARTLASVYESIWPLLFSANPHAESTQWRRRRDVVVGEWLKVVH